MHLIASLLRSLLIACVTLALVHVLGFAYAHYAAPTQSRLNPMALQRETLPFWPVYTAYLGEMVQLDFGTMPTTAAEPVALVILRAAGASLLLLGIALTLSVTLGVSLGIAALRTNPPRIQPWLTLLTTIGLAMPGFFVGVLGITAIIAILIWGPWDRPILPIEGFGTWRHLVLPTIVLMLRPTAHIAQLTAALMVEELGKPYVVAARSLGHREDRIIRRYVFRVIQSRLFAGIATMIRFMVGEMIIVEWLFYWPGLGRLIARTLIPSRISVSPDPLTFLFPPVVAGVLVVFAALFLFTGMLSTALGRAIDPRVRNE